MNQSKVFCIIVTYNGMKWIENCLRTIEGSSHPLEVIVIDNGSNDGTIELIEKQFQNVKLIKSERNLGFGAANNLGYKIALENNADYIYLLNQDTLSYPDTISKLIDVFEIDGSIAIASPFHLNDDGSKLDKKFEEYISANTCHEFISDSSLDQLKQYYPIGFVNAAAWLIKVSAIKQLGGLFSSAFYHYGEDSNFLSRMHYYKKKCVIVPRVFVHHLREDRKGKMSAAFEKQKLTLKKVQIMTNIHTPYKKALKILYKYAGQQLFYGNIRGAFELFTYPIIYKSQILKYRNSYTTENIL